MSFPEGTPITLSNGCVKNIESIKVGDIVLGNPEPREVEENVISKADDLITVRICKAPPLTATKDQIVRRLPREKVETGWAPGGKRARPFIVRDKTGIFEEDLDTCTLYDLRVGDYLIIRPFRKTCGSEFLSLKEVTGLDLSEEGSKIIRKVRGNSPTVCSKDNVLIDNDLLWLIGLYLAEGSCEEGRSGLINSVIFTLNLNETDLEQKIYDIVESKFGYRPCTIEVPEHTSRNVYINNQIIATLLVRLCGEGCETKMISDHIYNAPRSLLPMVGGWIDGDGGTVKQRRSVVGVTTSRNLARQMSTIMWSEGISHCVSIEKHSNGRKTTYRLPITGAYAQQMVSYTVKHKDYKFTPTYEDGLWADDCYCLRVLSKIEKNVSGDVFDLKINEGPYYQINGVLAV